MPSRSARRKRPLKAARKLHPPPAPRSPARPPRVIELAPQYGTLAAPIEGVPDLSGTRCLCFGMALLFLVMGVGLSAAMVADPPSHMGLFPLLLFVLMIGLLGLCVFLFARAGLRAGAWFRVDETGIRYGIAPAAERSVADETLLPWNEIVSHPERACDVSTEYAGPRALVKNLVLWRRLPSGELAEHRLGMRLTDDLMHCLRFRNHDELLRAVLQGLAARPGLRFNAEVFVDAGIDPATWQSMKEPRRAQWLPVWATLGLIFLVYWRLGSGWSAWQIAGVTLGIMLGGVLLMAWGWTRAYPDLTGVIAFRSGDPG